MSDSEPIYTNYTVPKKHGELLVEPSWEVACKVLFDSQDQANDSGCDNTFLCRWRHIARASLIQEAIDYTSCYRDVSHSLLDSQSAIVLGGHQPDLFHCGVWYKNFLLSQLGVRTGAIAVNLIVDNDLCRGAGILVPRISTNSASSQFVPFDVKSEAVAWENRRLLDRACWSSFAIRVGELLPAHTGEPIIHKLWKHTALLNCNQPLGLLLAQARHKLEAEIGLQTLEIPLSRLCQSTAFAAFSLHLLGQLHRLRASYNSELNNYRSAHRIRNHAQPLPNLEEKDGWLEVPWWTYTQSSERIPVWAMQLDDGSLLLTDRLGWQFQIVGSLDSSAAIEQWMAIEAQGRLLRPRALITTMFARLMLCDLFVHGIGGGKYDQITDRIIARMFQMKPPAMVVASATMRLPFSRIPEQLTEPWDSKILDAQQLLNKLTANPEQVLDQCNEGEISLEELQTLRRLADEKRKLLDAMPEKGEKWEWHLAMKKIKLQLKVQAQPILDARKAQLERMSEMAIQKSLIESREFSYCLFPLNEILAHYERAN